MDGFVQTLLLCILSYIIQVTLGRPKYNKPPRSSSFGAALLFGAPAEIRTRNVAVGGLCFIQLDYKRSSVLPHAAPVCACMLPYYSKSRAKCKEVSPHIPENFCINC